MGKRTEYQRGFDRGFQSGLEYAAICGVPQKILDSVGRLKMFQQTISAKDAKKAITSYEWVTGFDPKTGEAIWETFGTGDG